MNEPQKNNAAVIDALKAIGIEVITSQYCNGNRFRMRIAKDGYEAVTFSPARNGHDVGDWLKAAVSEAKRSLTLRGATFTAAPKTATAYKKADKPAPPAPEPPAAEPKPLPGPPPVLTVPEKKKRTFLDGTQRAEAYHMFNTKAANAKELADLYGVSVGTINNIINEGKAGKFDRVMLSPGTEAAPPVPRQDETIEPTGDTKHGSADGENWAGTYSPADIADTHAARIKLFADADRINMLLTKLQEYGAAVGLQVEYSLNIKMGK